MRWRIPNKRRQQMGLTDASIRRGSASLQIVLWTVWTLIVIAVGYVSWHADIVAQRPTNVLGLVIHCVVAGLIGLIIMTLIEMRVEPWRFIDDE
jgi:polyferredoxin